MENKTTMTAVEWLIRNLMLNGLIRLTKDQHKLYKELTDLAKQIEKEQRLIDYNVGYSDALCNHIRDGENYVHEISSKA